MTRFFSTLFFASTAAAAAIMMRDSTPATAPAESGFTISGTGCASSSNSVQRSGSYSSGEVFKLSNFTTSDTGNCEIHLSSKGGSSGWQVAIKSVRLTGTATCGASSEVDLYSQIYWSTDASATQTLKTSITSGGAFDVTQSASSGQVWSDCIGSTGNPGILNVNVRAVVASGTGSATISTEEWDFAWKECVSILS